MGTQPLIKEGIIMEDATVGSTLDEDAINEGDIQVLLREAVGTSIPSETVNIVPHIKVVNTNEYPSYYDPKTLKTGEQILEELGRVVVEEFEIDEDSRVEWKDNVAEDIKLFSSYMEKKDFPWPNSSNVSLPFLPIAALQFHARAYDALLPPKEIVKIIDMHGTDPEREKRVQAYMNFQLLYKMENFEEGMDKTLLQLPIEGSVFRKTFYDDYIQMNDSVHISALDFVVNYGARDLGPDTRKTHVLRKTCNVVKSLIRSGIYEDVGEEFLTSSEELSKSSLDEVKDKVLGITESASFDRKIRIVLEQHRGWDLDGDGIEEPYVITVDYETRKVLRITDRRYKDSLGREKIIEYFTHYVFIPNPLGFYGYGFGTLLRGLNAAANTIVNEVIDAGSLANLQGGFVSKRSGIKKGSLTFSRGEYKEVDAYIDDVRKAIYNFDFKGPNQTLYSVLGLLYEYSKLVASVSETMTGQLPASDTPATTVLALIEEGRKVFSSIHKRIHRSFKQELKKLYRLNSIYLNEVEYFRILGDKNIPQGDSTKIGKADFIDTLDIIPVSDPNITSRAEKILKAQQVKQEIMSNPLTSNNEKAIYVATRKLFEALDVQNIDELFPPPPEPQDIPPIEENSMIITEKTPTPLPQQDHAEHIQVHTNLGEGAFGSQLSPQAKNILEYHIKEHLGMLYLVEMQGGENG